MDGKESGSCSVGSHSLRPHGLWPVRLLCEFSRQEYWSGSPGDLPDPGSKPGSPALQADTSPSEPPDEKEHVIK